MTEHVPSQKLTAPTVLVTLTGADRSGVSTRLFEVLSGYVEEIVDVEQLVVRGRLVLSVLVTEPPAAKLPSLEQAVREVGAQLGLDVGFERGSGDNRPRRIGRSHVTVLGHPLHPAAMAAVTARIKAAGGNIDRVHRLARYPVTAIRLQVSGADPDQLQGDLAEVAFAHGVDLAVEERGILRHAQRLIVLDVDSTLIQGEVIEMLASHADCAAQVAAVTDSAMRGEIDFEASLRQRVAQLAGLPAEALDQVYRDLIYTPGARTMLRTLRRLGFRFALVSGGFSQIVQRIAADLQIDYYAANELEIIDGTLTGRILGDVVDRAGKAEALRRFAADARIGLKNTVAVGDGANDLDMLAAAGLGIAFNAKPLVRDQAKTSLTSPYLDSILYLMGITREEVESADAADESEEPSR